MGGTLSIEERKRALKLLSLGYTTKEVAKLYHVDPRTITGRTETKRTYALGSLRKSPRR